MRLQSKGLGRKELVLDFREYAATREGDELLIQGTIREPVRWDFSIRVCEDDLAGLVRVAGRRATIGLLLRSLFRRKKKHHWTGDRDEHVAQAREAGKAINEKIRKQREQKREAAKAETAEKAEKLRAVQAGPSGDSGAGGASDDSDGEDDRLEVAG